MTAPDRRLIFLLNVAQRRLQRWVEQQMAAENGLTSAQSGVLFYLGRDDGALIGDVALALDLVPSAMSGLADRMERAGLVERQTADGSSAWAGASGGVLWGADFARPRRREPVRPDLFQPLGRGERRRTFAGQHHVRLLGEAPRPAT